MRDLWVIHTDTVGELLSIHAALKAKCTHCEERRGGDLGCEQKGLGSSEHTAIPCTERCLRCACDPNEVSLHPPSQVLMLVGINATIVLSGANLAGHPV